MVFAGPGVHRGRDIVSAYLVDLEQRSQIEPQRRPSSGLQRESPSFFQVGNTGNTHTRDILNAELKPIWTLSQAQRRPGEIGDSQDDLTRFTGEKLVLVELQFYIHLSVDSHHQQNQAEPRR
jgi:hypothetical protein